MDPVTLIVAALAAGVALGVKDTASAAVKDAYDALLALVKNRLGGGPDADVVLAGYEQAPEAWQAPLMAALTRAGADSDRELAAAARALLELADQVRGEAGKYTADLRGAQGVQVGEHNRQENIFRPPS